MKRVRPLSAAERDRLEPVLRRACGLTLAQGLHAALDLSVELAAASLGISARELFQRAICGDRKAVQALLEHTLVHESYFFRQPRHFEAFRSRVLERLAPGEEALVWSAGCAGGEEAYSLAITVALAGSPPARIVASDVSQAALRRAKGGRYSAWSLRGLDASVRQQFFEPDSEPASLQPGLRERVEWLHHNLVNDLPPVRSCHAIFCRNVLIYFDRDVALEVLGKLVGALRPGGYLMLGTAEAPLASGLGLKWIEDDEAFVRAPADRPPPRRSPAFGSGATPGWSQGGLGGSGAQAQPPGDRRSGRSEPLPKRAEAPRVVEPPLSRFDQARAAARRGLALEAERLARDSAEQESCPESFLLLSMMAEERGELGAAVEAARRAVALDHGMAMGHATLAMLLQRLGAADEAERARSDALEVLARLDASTPLRSVEPITAGALRQALQHAAGS